MTALAGKHALVTGGGSGIGAAIALALADAGANVTITGRRLKPLEEFAAGKANVRAHVADVTDETALADAFSTAAQEFGPISIVVANAGIAESSPFAKTSREAFERILSINLTGVFLTFREGVKAMTGSGWGR